MVRTRFLPSFLWLATIGTLFAVALATNTHLKHDLLHAHHSASHHAPKHHLGHHHDEHRPEKHHHASKRPFGTISRIWTPSQGPSRRSVSSSGRALQPFESDSFPGWTFGNVYDIPSWDGGDKAACRAHPPASHPPKSKIKENEPHEVSPKRPNPIRRDTTAVDKASHFCQHGNTPVTPPDESVCKSGHIKNHTKLKSRMFPGFQAIPSFGQIEEIVNNGIEAGKQIKMAQAANGQTDSAPAQPAPAQAGGLGGLLGGVLGGGGGGVPGLSVVTGLLGGGGSGAAPASPPAAAAGAGGAEAPASSAAFTSSQTGAGSANDQSAGSAAAAPAKRSLDQEKCHAGYQTLFTNAQQPVPEYSERKFGSVVSDQASFLHWGLVQSVAQCLQACDQTEGCVFANVYQQSFNLNNPMVKLVSRAGLSPDKVTLVDGDQQTPSHTANKGHEQEQQSAKEGMDERKKAFAGKLQRKKNSFVQGQLTCALYSRCFAECEADHPGGGQVFFGRSRGFCRSKGCAGAK